MKCLKQILTVLDHNEEDVTHDLDIPTTIFDEYTTHPLNSPSDLDWCLPPSESGDLTIMDFIQTALQSMCKPSLFVIGRKIRPENLFIA